MTLRGIPHAGGSAYLAFDRVPDLVLYGDVSRNNPTRDPSAPAISGCLMGTAVGDAVGLPYEGLSRRRVQRWCGEGALGYHFFLGHGFCSDDTEHTCMAAQSLLVARAHPDTGRFVSVFRRSFAWRLRLWLLGLPAGIGLATLKSIVRLWFDPATRGDGVNSAGNGPAMRSAIVGVCLGGDPELMRRVIGASTRLTHTDPRAEHGALAVALAAALAAERRETPARETFPAAFERTAGEAAGEMSVQVRRAAQSACRGESTQVFAAAIGCERGVTGFVMHTVPVALHAWFSHERDFEGAIEAVVRCGGDTDTVAAIVGGIVGAGVGAEGIPERWLDGLWEWPRTRSWMETLGDRLATAFTTESPAPTLPLNPLSLMVRNLLFMAVVLLHGFRRMLPPY